MRGQFGPEKRRMCGRNINQDSSFKGMNEVYKVYSMASQERNTRIPHLQEDNQQQDNQYQGAN